MDAPGDLGRNQVCATAPTPNGDQRFSSLGDILTLFVGCARAHLNKQLRACSDLGILPSRM